ncbi:MAG: COP23 domain-containing protein [Cyanobacteria bacterium P01_F01_bin.143]
MNIQNLCFNSLAVTITAMVSINPVSAQSSKTSFFCETQEGIPTTIAQTENGNMQPIFYWKSEALPTESDPQQLCDEVSQQLDNYLFSDSELSSLGFKSAKLDKLPVICATEQNNECNLVLFTLPPAEQPVDVAGFVLASILEPKLQSERIVSSDRGVQSIYYKVNLWKLLGF